jgi:hypothetical protein
MDRKTLVTLLADYHHRELPEGYRLISPAAEVAALLKQQAADKRQRESDAAADGEALVRTLADITHLAYLLDGAVNRFEQPLLDAGLKKVYRELRVLRGQLNQILGDTGFTWHEPLREPFEGELPELVSVDGWRYGSQYEEPCVAEVREAIVLRDGTPVREGSVIIGAPEVEDEPEMPELGGPEGPDTPDAEQNADPSGSPAATPGQAEPDSETTDAEG